MAFASVGARTPFITSRPSNAVTLASPAVALKPKPALGLGLGSGLAAVGLASALEVFAAFSFPVFASLFPAIAGTAVMASTSRLDNQLFSFNIDGFLLVPAPFRPEHRTWGATLCCFRDNVKSSGHIIL